MLRLSLAACLVGAASSADAVTEALRETCDEIVAKYDVSCSMAIYGSYGGRQLDETASAGFIDSGLGLGPKEVAAKDDDVYVYGSITKMFTAAAIYRLVEKGVLGLDDSLAFHVDAMLPGAASLASAVLVNDTARAGTVTLRDALHMRSGISDYDGKKYYDAQFSDPSRDFSPLDVLLGGFVNGSLEFTPGAYQDYSSTNYILLGLVAARYTVPGATDDPAKAWREFDQRAAAVGTLSEASTFVDAGACAAFTNVKGYMEQRRGATLEVSNVSCVGGWTAGNFVGPIRDVAVFTNALYGLGGVVSNKSLEDMTDFGDSRFKWYGAGTFDLSFSVGGDVPAVGHVGDTYGYQSQSTYFPDLGFTIAVATNAEMEAQAQPGDATCRAYHKVKTALGLAPKTTCDFAVPRGRRFMGTCECRNATAAAY